MNILHKPVFSTLKTLLFSGLCFSCFTAFAQIPKTNQASNLYWVTVGGGLSNLGSTAGGALSHQFKSNLISVRFLKNFNLDAGYKTWDIAGIYGKSYKSPQAMISFGTGIAFVNTNDLSEKSGTVGLPFESQIFWTPTRFFGVGIYGFGNINSIKSFGGALLGIQIGRVTSPLVK